MVWTIIPAVTTTRATNGRVHVTRTIAIVAAMCRGRAKDLRISTDMTEGIPATTRMGVRGTVSMSGTAIGPFLVMLHALDHGRHRGTSIEKIHGHGISVGQHIGRSLEKDPATAPVAIALCLGAATR